MVHRPGEWFRIVAVLSGLTGVAAVFLLNEVIHMSLPIWVHIPLVVAVLTLMGAGGVACGVAFVEADARTGSSSS